MYEITNLMLQLDVGKTRSRKADYGQLAKPGNGTVNEQCMSVAISCANKMEQAQCDNLVCHPKYIHTLYSRNVGENSLPDINIQILRAAVPRAEGVYIRQTMSAHVTTVMYHLVIGHKPEYVTNNSSKH